MRTTYDGATVRLYHLGDDGGVTTLRDVGGATHPARLLPLPEFAKNIHSRLRG